MLASAGSTANVHRHAVTVRTGFRGDATATTSEPWDWRKAAAEKFKGDRCNVDKLRLEVRNKMGAGERQAAITAIAIQER